MSSPDSLSNNLLRFILQQYDNTVNTSRYLNYIQTSLNKHGQTYLFNGNIPENMTLNRIKTLIKTQNNDIYLQKWTSDLNSSSKVTFYKSIKPTFQFEPYLDILPTKFWTALTKFRLSNHRLPIEVGRWNNIPRHETVCPRC